MSAPLELRHYLRRFTLEDAKVGIVPIKQLQDGKVELFSAPCLQFRVRGKDGWTEWQDVKYWREGDEQA